MDRNDACDLNDSKDPNVPVELNVPRDPDISMEEENHIESHVHEESNQMKESHDPLEETHSIEPTIHCESNTPNESSAPNKPSAPNESNVPNESNTPMDSNTPIDPNLSSELQNLVEQTVSSLPPNPSNDSHLSSSSSSPSLSPSPPVSPSSRPLQQIRQLHAANRRQSALFDLQTSDSPTPSHSLLYFSSVPIPPSLITRLTSEKPKYTESDLIIERKRVELAAKAESEKVIALLTDSLKKTESQVVLGAENVTTRRIYGSFACSWKKRTSECSRC